jgi:folylpolyglutamate synthase
MRTLVSSKYRNRSPAYQAWLCRAEISSHVASHPISPSTRCEVRGKAMLKCTPNPSPFHLMLLAPIKRPSHSPYTCFLRCPISNFTHYHTTTPRSIMDESRRTYANALTLLNTLQSNRTIVNNIKQSDRDMNLDAIPEMLNWVARAGYRVEDFNKLRVIHVAGTKGKGSVCALVASIFQQYSSVTNLSRAASNEGIKTDGANQNPGTEAEGLGKVGLYTSPHLVTVRERIRINNEPISQSLFASHFFTLWDRFSASASAAGLPNPCSPETKPGYFRYLTIMALHVFLQEGVTTAVVECGIGGEYDSTNILTKEAVTVSGITRLGIDHVGMLGDTLDKIAWHKGGIMKEAVQCFTVPQELEAMQVLEERAKEKLTELAVVERRKDIESGDVKIGLEGDFQKDNASLAVAVAGAHLSKMGFGDVLHGEKLPEEFLRGLEQVSWEGRCEVMAEGNIEWCIDGAHTVESIKVTADWFTGKLRRSTKAQAMLIFNQQERDGAVLALALHMALERATGMRHIFSNAAFCTNAPYKTVNPNEDPIADDLRIQRTISDTWSEFEPDTEIEVYSSIEEAVENAREISKESEKLLVLVTGSLHLVGGFLKVLQGDNAAS